MMLRRCLVGLVLLAMPAMGQDLSTLVERAAAYEFGESTADLRKLEAKIRDGAGDAQANASARAALAAALSGDASSEAKRFFCRQLAIVGDASSVPALKTTLADQDVAELGVYALARINAPQAAEALRESLSALEGPNKIAAIMALGEKRDALSFRAIASAGRTEDAELRAAVLQAIGRIADHNVASALEQAIVLQEEADSLDLQERNLAAAALDATLICAHRQLESGDTTGASRLYQLIAENAIDSHARMAATRGLVMAGGATEADRVAALLQTGSNLERGFAARLIEEVPGPQFTRALANELKHMSSGTKVAAIGALARRGDQTANPAIEALITTNDETVADAAIQALGELGDGSSARAILRALDRGLNNRYALGALSRMRDPSVDDALSASIESAKGRAQVTIARALGARLAYGHADALLPLARGTADEPRRAALDSLASIGSSRHILPVADLLRARAGQNHAEQTLAALIKASDDPDGWTTRVTESLADGGTRVERSRLRVLAMVANDAAMQHLQTALGQPEFRATAIEALVHFWPDDRALDSLFAIADEPKGDDERAIALTGLLRLADRITLREASETAAHYRRIAPHVQTDRDRRTLLKGLIRVSDPGVLPIARDMFDSPRLGRDAQAATLTIATRLDKEDRLAALAAVDSVREAGSAALAENCDIAQNHIEQDLDFITSWMVSGPYGGAPANELIPTRYAPETGNSAVNWRELRTTSSTFPGEFDLNKQIGGGNHCVYVRTEMWIPRTQKIRLEIGSDDGVKVFVDGESVLERNVMRGVTLGEDVVEVNLDKGWHTLMLKVAQGNGGWGFACRVRGTDYLSIPGFRAVANPRLAMPPPGAIVLFDGQDASRWMHPNGQEASWTIERGRMTVRPRSGALVTREPLSDGRYYIEFMTSEHEPNVRGQARGNSGVYLQGRYEVQVLDSWGDAPAHNRCAGIYGKKAPDAAVAARPGEWQTYLIDFTAPRWSDSGRKLSNAMLTVWHNGVLVHENVEVDSSTGSGRSEGVEAGPMLLQDHGNLVSYGRIWHEPRPVAWEGPDAPGFTKLIGNSLDGWIQRGGKAEYRNDDGVIVGQTRPNQPNSFLCTERDYDNFVLELEFKVDAQLNSGVQIRSNSNPEHANGRVHGYQVEIDPSARSWTAGIYDESRRGWLANLANNEPGRKAFKAGEWNRLRVVARGDQMLTYLNGVRAAVLVDDMTPSGFIGLQVHGVGGRTDPLEVRWRDVRIRELD